MQNGTTGRNTTTCCWPKFWVKQPGSLGKGILAQDRWEKAEPSFASLNGLNYLNYHRFRVDVFSMASCRFCGEGCKEFIDLACQRSALAFECLGVLHVLHQPPDLTGLIRLIQVRCIGRVMEWRAERIKHSGVSPRQVP